MSTPNPRQILPSLAPTLLAMLTLAACTLTGCARSRAEQVRDRSAMVETNLELARDKALSGDVQNSRDIQISHLQTLQFSLSMVNISLASVPYLLTTEDQREIGYSVLDEALGTIDWNIPLAGYAVGGVGGAGGMGGAGLRPFPALFSPQSGLNFGAIQGGNVGNASGTPPPGAMPPGIAR